MSDKSSETVFMRTYRELVLFEMTDIVQLDKFNFYNGNKGVTDLRNQIMSENLKQFLPLEECAKKEKKTSQTFVTLKSDMDIDSRDVCEDEEDEL